MFVFYKELCFAWGVCSLTEGKNSIRKDGFYPSSRGRQRTKRMDLRVPPLYPLDSNSPPGEQRFGFSIHHGRERIVRVLFPRCSCFDSGSTINTKCTPSPDWIDRGYMRSNLCPSTSLILARRLPVSLSLAGIATTSFDFRQFTWYRRC